MKNAQSTYRATGSAAHRITAALCLSVLCMVMLLAVPGTALAQIDLTDWMKYLPDDMQISQINMPGTHDSGTEYCNVVINSSGDGPILNKHDTLYKPCMRLASTQDWTIQQQLENGIRVLDIRLTTPFNGKDQRYDLPLCHGPSTMFRETTSGRDVPLTLSYVINDWVTPFLNAHSNETVVLILAEERDKKHTPALIESLLEEHHHTKPESAKHWKKVMAYKSGERVPKLGDVRGKIVMIWDNGSYTEYEMHYKNYGDQPVSPEKKAQMMLDILYDPRPENHNWRMHMHGESNDTFSRSVYSFPDGKGDPNTPKIIGTNLTCCSDNISDVLYALTVKSAKENAQEFWNAIFHLGLKTSWYDHTRFVTGCRYGWILMDMPQDKCAYDIIEDIIESNYAAPVYKYEMHFDFDLIRHPEWTGLTQEQFKSMVSFKSENVVNGDHAFPETYEVSIREDKIHKVLSLIGSFTVRPISDTMGMEPLRVIPQPITVAGKTLLPIRTSRDNYPE